MRVFQGMIITLFLVSLSYAQAINIGVINDLNGTECQVEYPLNSIDNFNQLYKTPALDMVLFPGDLVHGECLSSAGRSPTYPAIVEKMWLEFNKLFLAPLDAKKIPFTIAPGNHDAPSEGPNKAFQVEREGFEKYWSQNENAVARSRIILKEAPDKYPYYWAHIKNDVLYVVLESTSAFNLTNRSHQKKWLKALLFSEERKTAKHVIAMGHVPPYPVLNLSEKKYAEVLTNEQVGKLSADDKKNGHSSLMDLLLDANVDLLVVAHSHVPYPGKLTRLSDNRSIKILSTPCSHAPRKMFGKSTPAPRGHSKIQISDKGIHFAFYSASDGSLIPYETFPEEIKLKDSKLIEYRRIDGRDYTIE